MESQPTDRKTKFNKEIRNKTYSHEREDRHEIVVVSRIENIENGEVNNYLWLKKACGLDFNVIHDAEQVKRDFGKFNLIRRNGKICLMCEGTYAVVTIPLESRSLRDLSEIRSGRIMVSINNEDNTSHITGLNDIKINAGMMLCVRDSWWTPIQRYMQNHYGQCQYAVELRVEQSVDLAVHNTLAELELEDIKPAMSLDAVDYFKYVIANNCAMGLIEKRLTKELELRGRSITVEIYGYAVANFNACLVMSKNTQMYVELHLAMLQLRDFYNSCIIIQLDGVVHKFILEVVKNTFSLCSNKTNQLLSIGSMSAIEYWNACTLLICYKDVMCDGKCRCINEELGVTMARKQREILEAAKIMRVEWKQYGLKSGQVTISHVWGQKYILGDVKDDFVALFQLIPEKTWIDVMQREEFDAYKCNLEYKDQDVLVIDRMIADCLDEELQNSALYVCDWTLRGWTYSELILAGNVTFATVKGVITLRHALAVIKDNFFGGLRTDTRKYNDYLKALSVRQWRRSKDMIAAMMLAIGVTSYKQLWEEWYKMQMQHWGWQGKMLSTIRGPLQQMCTDYNLCWLTMEPLELQYVGNQAMRITNFRDDGSIDVDGICINPKDLIKWAIIGRQQLMENMDSVNVRRCILLESHTYEIIVAQLVYIDKMAIWHIEEVFKIPGWWINTEDFIRFSGTIGATATGKLIKDPLVVEQHIKNDGECINLY